jgi:hypothetical protein
MRRSTDRILTTHVGGSRIHPELGWAKLSALAEGAALASSRLWKA